MSRVLPPPGSSSTALIAAAKESNDWEHERAKSTPVAVDVADLGVQQQGATESESMESGEDQQDREIEAGGYF